MTTSVRLTENERELIRKKSIEINQKLISKGKQPLRDSQIVHEILEKTLPKIQVGESGNLIFW